MTGAVDARFSIHPPSAPPSPIGLFAIAKRLEPRRTRRVGCLSFGFAALAAAMTRTNGSWLRSIRKLQRCLGIDVPAVVTAVPRGTRGKQDRVEVANGFGAEVMKAFEQ